MSQPCFVPGWLLVPGEGVSPEQWACPSAGALSRESWRELEARRENAPGAMQLLVPDALLQRVETRERLAAAKAAMTVTPKLLTSPWIIRIPKFITDCCRQVKKA